MPSHKDTKHRYSFRWRAVAGCGSYRDLLIDASIFWIPESLSISHRACCPILLDIFTFQFSVSSMYCSVFSFSYLFQFTYQLWDLYWGVFPPGYIYILWWLFLLLQYGEWCYLVIHYSCCMLIRFNKIWHLLFKY